MEYMDKNISQENNLFRQEEVEAFELSSKLHTERIVGEFTEASFGGDAEKSHQFVDQIKRVRDLAHVFLGNVLPPEAVDIAALYELNKEAQGQGCQGDLINYALADYYTAPGMRPDIEQYAASLIDDMAYIEHYSKWYQTAENIEADWSKIESPPSIASMAEMVKAVNIEAILLKSCTVIDKLIIANQEMFRAGQTNYDDEVVFSLMTEAETFYGPLCEILAFDGISSELRSQARQLRLMKLGQIDHVIDVEKRNDKMCEIGAEGFIDALVGGEDYEVVRATKKSEHRSPYVKVDFRGVELGDFTMQIDGNEMNGRWRIKSVGSLASKEAEGYGTPMDVLGLTSISNELEDSAEEFALTIKRLTASDRLYLKPAPSKSKAIYVQGSEQYIKSMCAGFSPDFAEKNIQTKVLDEAAGKVFSVAKFTCMLDDELPVEMQFLTQEARRDARIGETSHWMYKMRKDGLFYSQEEMVSSLDMVQEIYRRKQNMLHRAGKIIINERSRQRSLSHAELALAGAACSSASQLMYSGMYDDLLHRR